MNKKLTIIVSACVVFVLGFIILGSYNSLSRNKNSVDKAWSQVEVSYQRRSDLIPNLVTIAKEASVREQEILESALEARANALKSNVSEGDTTALDSSQSEVTSALSNLIAISESYPDLKSNENWVNLQSQIEGTENRVAVARADYNDAVEKYNRKVVTFPSSMFAKIFGFEKVDYFSSSDGSSDVPIITFSDNS